MDFDYTEAKSCKIRPLSSYFLTKHESGGATAVGFHNLHSARLWFKNQDSIANITKIDVALGVDRRAFRELAVVPNPLDLRLLVDHCRLSGGLKTGDGVRLQWPGNHAP